MSKNARKILKQAEKAKAAAKNLTLKKQKYTLKPKNKTRAITIGLEDRFKVHQILNGRFVGLLWFLSISFLVVSGVFWIENIMSTSVFLYLAVLCVSLPLLGWIYIFLEIRLKYASFKHWRKKLPFDFIGWQDLVDHPDFGWSNWRSNAVLTIDFKEGSDFIPQINSLLHLFIKKANKEFYPRGSSPGLVGDPRIKWTVKDNQATGSINAGVTKVLYKFLKNELSTVAQAYQNIEKVTISVKSRSIYIPYQSSDID